MIWSTLRFLVKLCDAFGLWLVSMVDYPTAVGLSYRAISYNQKKQHMSLTNSSVPVVQYFYIRKANNCSSTHRGAPVGVIAFTPDPDAPNVFRVAGSMVSRKDLFVKATGVAKAVGRLNGDYAVFGKTEFENMPLYQVIANLDLASVRGNFYSEVDWSLGDKTKQSAITSLEARCASTPTQ